MKRFLEWLETKFSPHSAAVEADEPHTTVRVRIKPKDIAEEEYSVEVAFDTSAPGRVQSDEPGENVLNPDKYADDTMTKRALPSIDQQLDASESTGFDPYDTGRNDPSKKWKSSYRK